MTNTKPTIAKVANGRCHRAIVAVKFGLCLFLGFAVAIAAGCGSMSEHKSLGDWMRGNHKPITPDDSVMYPPPQSSAISRSLASAEVRLDGSRDGDRIGANAQTHTVRQFPDNYSIPPGGAPVSGGYPQSSYNVAPAPGGSVAQGSGLGVNPNVIPGNAQPTFNTPPSLAQPGAMGQFQGAPNGMVAAPGNQGVVTQAPVVSGPGVQYTPNMTPFGAQPNSFTPTGSNTFPPIGTEPPLYTPTLREADLIINGYPARTGRIMFGGAVNSDAGVTGQVTIDERNFDIRRWPTSFSQLFTGQAFRGAGETFRVEAAPGSDFDRYTVQWATPNLFNYLPFSFSVSGFLFDRRFNDWDEERKGGRVSWGYRITPDLSLSIGLSGQTVEVSNPRNGLSTQLNDVLGDNTLYSGSVSLKHDTRNSPIQASDGHYFEFSFEQAFGDFDYSRFELEFRQYWLLADRIDGSGKQTLSFSTQLGFSGDETPVFENFFAGGYATIRGFDFRGASPLENTIEVGGQFKWLNTLEYMFPITADDAFRGVAFVDFGTVEEDIEINGDNFRVAPGAGIRVAIPALGPAPLAFDFAFPVAKADTDDERVFSFYMSLIR